MSRVRKRWAIVASLGSCVIALALAGQASAQVTLGQLAPTSPASGECGGGASGSFYWQLELGEGASYEVPAPGGVLTSWSTRAAGGAGQFLTLKVLRPLGGKFFAVVGTDGPRALAPGAVDTTLTNLPVQPGDVIGIYTGSALESANTTCRFSTSNEDDIPAFGFSPSAGPVEIEGFNLKWRANLSAIVLLSPTVESLATTAGPLTGGTSVTISGTEFEDVTAVHFGAVAAQSFTVHSAGQITAVSPAGAAGSVPVTVTTIAGTAASGGQFTYRPPPTVTALSPVEGSTAGGTAVTISGAAFEEATEVDFGSTPAQSYSVDSAGQITAVSPASGAGPVSVSVTTPWGTAASSPLFTYIAPSSGNPPANETGPVPTAGPIAPENTAASPTTAGPPSPSRAASCTVPKLTAKKLSTAKKAIAAAHCKVGTVTKKKGVTAKTGKVVKQSPKVGTSKPAGSKVNLTLG
jgi:PASTA domain/IPT/TIG domain